MTVKFLHYATEFYADDPAGSLAVGYLARELDLDTLIEAATWRGLSLVAVLELVQELRALINESQFTQEVQS